MFMRNNFWDYVFFALMVIVVAVVIGRTLRYIIGRGVKGATRKLNIVDPTKYNFLKNTVESIVYLSAFIIIFNDIPPLKKYGTALFAGAGVFAAIVGFASQSAFSNIISGIFIVIFRPFSVGDRVRIGQLYAGDVEDITLRHTIIKDFENRRIVIPNSVMNNETIINSTIVEEKVCIFIDIEITFESQAESALQIMREEAMNHPNCIDNRSEEAIAEGDPKVKVRLIDFTPAGQQLRAYVWAEDPSKGFEMKCDLLQSVKTRFDASRIQIASTSRTILIRENLTSQKI
jgi:small conductance mechanosensitive channel